MSCRFVRGPCVRSYFMPGCLGGLVFVTRGAFSLARIRVNRSGLVPRTMARYCALHLVPLCVFIPVCVYLFQCAYIVTVSPFFAVVVWACLDLFRCYGVCCGVFYIETTLSFTLSFTLSLGLRLKKGQPNSLVDLRFSWSGGLDSNQRPLDPQSSALPNCATTRCKGYYQL